MPDDLPHQEPDRGPDEVLVEFAQALGDPFPAVVAHRLTQLSPTVVAKLATWAPDLASRNVSRRQWDEWQPLVRTAGVCARPSSETVASAQMGTALGLVQHAVTSRRTPLRAEFIFRTSSAELYLDTLAPGTRTVYVSHLKALVPAVTSALTEPVPAPACVAAGDGATEEQVGEVVVEPLLLDRPQPTPRQLAAVGLTGPGAAELIDVLALVRARVLEVEPGAFRREDRFAGRARAVPYGDVELVALLAATGALRATKSRTHTHAVIGLGLGAGLAGEAAARVQGAQVTAHHPAVGGPTVTTVNGPIPVYACFAPPLLAAAKTVGNTGWLVGGSNDRIARVSAVAATLSKANPHLVRLNSARLAATWLAFHATRGVPVADLLALHGYTSAAPIDTLLPYLPTRTDLAHALLLGPTSQEPRQLETGQPETGQEERAS